MKSWGVGVGWGGGWRVVGLGSQGGGGRAGSLRCAASGGRGDSLLGPRAPGEGIRTCPDSQPPSSQQQGDELPQQPLPPPLPQLKVWLSCRLERNKTEHNNPLTLRSGTGTHTYTQAGTLLPLFLLHSHEDKTSCSN